MKHILFFSAVVLFSCNLNAQIQKGNWLLGLSGYASIGIDNALSSGAMISPDFAYFPVNRLAIGTATIFAVSPSSTTSFGFNPFVRVYALPSGKFNLFAQPSYTILKYSSSENTASGLSIGAGPAFFLNDYVALELAATYSKISLNSYVSKSLLMTIGLQVHLGGKKE